jgi:acetyl esterase/lipase
MANGKNYRRNSKHRLLSAVALFLSAIAFLSTIWIVVPAPHYTVWLFSVLTSEWSLGFGFLALTGIFLASFTKSRVRFLTVSLGFLAFAIALYPFLSVFSAHRQSGSVLTTLSLSEYSYGFWTRNPKLNFTTETYEKIDDNDLKVDIYAPTDGSKRNGAAIVVVHGGSWNAGERSDFPLWNEWLINNGFTVFDVDYRLAPQPNWQTAVGDVKCAVAWIQRNSTRFSIDADKIVLFGRSAGGQIALMATYSDNISFPSTCENNPADKIRAVVSFYAPVDLIWGYDNPANERVIDGKRTLSRYLGGDPHESDEIRNRFTVSSPNNNVNAQTPPTFLVHGGEDQLVRFQNMEFLDEKLAENNVLHEKIYLSYAQHGFDYNFHGWGAQIVKPKLLKFILENTK